MKAHTLSLLFAVFSFFSFSQEGINWYTLEEAEKAATSQSDKTIVIMFTTHWCGPCKMMERSTFKDPKVISYVNEHYLMVKFNAEGGKPVTFKGKTYSNPEYQEERSHQRNSMHEFTKACEIAGYPTFYFLDKDLNELLSQPGYRNPEKFITLLESVQEKLN